MVVVQELCYALAGLGLGLVASLMASRLLSGLLFGVSASDPVTFASALALMLGVAFTASYLPARRAAKVDPASALRSL